jgi:hypothetical protein
VAGKRFILLDHNITGIGGHFAELASVILRGASAQGYEPWLVTHQALQKSYAIAESNSVANEHAPPQFGDDFRILPAFTVSKMHRWSLAHTGHSRIQRTESGKPLWQGWQTVGQLVVDKLHQQSPTWMVQQYSQTVERLFKDLQPTANDLILFGTCDDFSVLAVAAALKRLDLDQALNLNFLFHTNLIDSRQGQWRQQNYCNRQFVAQMQRSWQSLSAHRVQFWATTHELSEQLNVMTGMASGPSQRELSPTWAAIDYPVRDGFRPQSVHSRVGSASGPRKLIMGGRIRSEKGSKQIRGLIESIWDSHLQNGQWQLYLQASQAAALAVLPRRARSYCRDMASTHPQSSPVRWIEENLSGSQYEALIQSADAGLFLYDSRRYYARCSGVLVEMLSCGIPAIVPAGCWLSRQIAPELNKWMEQQDAQQELLLDSRRRLMRTARCQRWPRVTFDTQGAKTILVEADFQTTRNDDYVGFQLHAASHRACYRTQTDYCEVSANQTVRTMFQLDANCESAELSVGLPFQQRTLELHRLRIAKVATTSGAQQPAGSVGLVASELSEFPRLLSELTEHYGHYRETAERHAKQWSVQHSGAAFVQKLLAQASRSALRAA